METILNFRDLKAEEIEVRVSQVKQTGVQLLLYKDARCDMAILDETVGPDNWTRDHKELKGNIYAGVGIWDSNKGIWVWKWDAGKESNTEKEKGEASDSFKRACVNWGIGRELYTPIFIWINSKKCNIEERKDKKGVYKCNDNFVVSHITIENKKITSLEIVNSDGELCFSWGWKKPETKPKKETTPKKEKVAQNKETVKKEETIEDMQKSTLISDEKHSKLIEAIGKSNITDMEVELILEKYGYKTTKEIQELYYNDLIKDFKQLAMSKKEA